MDCIVALLFTSSFTPRVRHEHCVLPPSCVSAFFYGLRCFFVCNPALIAALVSSSIQAVTPTPFYVIWTLSLFPFLRQFPRILARKFKFFHLIHSRLVICVAGRLCLPYHPRHLHCALRVLLCDTSYLSSVSARLTNEFIPLRSVNHDEKSHPPFSSRFSNLGGFRSDFFFVSFAPRP